MLAQEVRKLENENAALRKMIKDLETNINESETKPMACKHCKYYIQHYVFFLGEYSETHCGHCTHGRCKERRPDTKSCEYFEFGKYGMGR